MNMDQYFKLTTKDICLRRYFNCLFPNANPYKNYGGNEYDKKFTIIDVSSECFTAFLKCFQLKESARTPVFISTTSTVPTTFTSTTTASSLNFSTLSGSTSVPTTLFTELPLANSSISSISSNMDHQLWILLVIALVLGYLLLSIYCVKWTHRLYRFIHFWLNKSEYIFNYEIPEAPLFKIPNKSNFLF